MVMQRGLGSNSSHRHPRAGGDPAKLHASQLTTVIPTKVGTHNNLTITQSFKPKADPMVLAFVRITVAE
jgi:hypothetical protein